MSRVYAEEGTWWLRVSPGHAVTEEWLRDRAPDLYADWWAAPSAEARDQVALQIERRLEDLESTGPPTDRRQQAQPSALADRVALYENNAERLGTIALDDPGRPAAHLAHQAEGDALRDELGATRGDDVGELLERRLDVADLIAVRLFIDAISGMTMEVDRLAAWALTQAGDVPMLAVGDDVVRAEMAGEDPHAALRTDVLNSVAASLHDTGQVIATAGADSRELHEAHRMCERSVDRAAIGEWVAAAATAARPLLDLVLDRPGPHQMWTDAQPVGDRRDRWAVLHVHVLQVAAGGPLHGCGRASWPVLQRGVRRFEVRLVKPASRGGRADAESPCDLRK